MSPFARGTLPAPPAVLTRMPWGIIAVSACVSVSVGWRLGAGGGTGRYWWALAAGAATLATAGRHRYPVRTWALVTAACALLIAFMPRQHSAGVQVPLLVFAAPLIALYAVTLRAGRLPGRVALVVSAAALGIALGSEYVSGQGAAAAYGLRCGPGPRCVAVPAAGTGIGYDRLAGLQIVLLFLGVLVAAWALGERARASSQAVTAQAERAAAEERARIAAELHDITAHHISVVALQAGAARMLAESGQPADIGLLSGIETASRNAMTEIREALGVIRGTADGPVPQPRAAQLPELAARMAPAGLAVTLEGAPGYLPTQLDLAVYRVVQESLSNALRHSAAGAALVRFRRTAGQLEITVTDHGPARERGPAPAGTGQGLTGLRERVQRLGGQLTASSRADGGFEVCARLPVPGTGPRRADLAARATP